MKNPRVELGFWIPQEHGGTVLRVAGQVEWVDDPALKYRSFEERPFLARLGLKPEIPDLVLFRISRGEVYPVQMRRSGSGHNQWSISHICRSPLLGNDSWYPGNKENYL